MQSQDSQYQGSIRHHSGYGWLLKLVCFPVHALLRLLEPLVSSVSVLIAVSGILVSVVLEWSGSAPHFPFWGALAFFIGCGLVPVIYRFLIRVTAP